MILPAPMRQQKEKPDSSHDEPGFLVLLPATTYSPTELPLQYHRR